MVITELSDDFNWGLGSVLLPLGHVKIINEGAVASSDLRSVNSSSSLGHLVVNVILSLVGRRLGRETKTQGLEVIGQLSLQKLSNVGRFTSSGRSGNQDVLVGIEKGPHHPLHANRVKGGDHNLIVRECDVNVVLLDGVVPRFPLLLIHVPNVIVDQAFFGEWHAGLDNAFTQVLVEFGSSFEVGSASNGPSEGKKEDFLDHSSEVFNLFTSHLLELSLNVGCHEAGNNAHGRLGDVVIASLNGLSEPLSGEIAGVN